MPHRILIIEDEPDLAELIASNLACDGFEAEVAGTGPDGLERALSGEHALVILDLMLPGMSGIDVLRALRREREVPVVIVSARSQEADIVVGLELGADDYITKPFGIRELTARIRALLRRADQKAPVQKELQGYRVGDLVFDFRQRQLRKGRTAHALSHTENEVLRFLIARRGEPASRNEILNAVWGEDAYPTTRTIDNFVMRLRGKLEDEPKAPRYLLTVHGLGYQWVADARDNL